MSCGMRISQADTETLEDALANGRDRAQLGTRCLILVVASEQGFTWGGFGFHLDLV